MAVPFRSVRVALAHWFTTLAAGTGKILFTGGDSFYVGYGSTLNGTDEWISYLRNDIATQNGVSTGVGWIPAFTDAAEVGAVAVFPFGWGFLPSITGVGTPTRVLTAALGGNGLSIAASGHSPDQILTCTRLEIYYTQKKASGGSIQLRVDGTLFGSPTATTNAGLSTSTDSGHLHVTWTSADPNVPETHTFRIDEVGGANSIIFDGAHADKHAGIGTYVSGQGGKSATDYVSGGTLNPGALQHIANNPADLYVHSMSLNAYFNGISLTQAQADLQTIVNACHSASVSASHLFIHEPRDGNADLTPPKIPPSLADWEGSYLDAVVAVANSLTPNGYVVDLTPTMGDLYAGDPHNYKTTLDHLHLLPAGYRAWADVVKYPLLMATNNNVSSITATLSGTTVDTALITQFWDFISVYNQDSTHTCYVRFDGTDPTAGAGSFPVPPASTVVFGPAGIKNSNGIPGNTTPATACHYVKILGNGGTYTISGRSQSSSGGSAGSNALQVSNNLSDLASTTSALSNLFGGLNISYANGQVTVSDGTASDGKISFGVTNAGFNVASAAFYKNTGDTQAVLNVGMVNNAPFFQTGPGGSTALTTVELIKSLAKSTTDTGSTTTAEIDLFTDTIAANTLTANFDVIDFSYSGSVTSTGGTTKRVRVYFGGTVIWDTTALAISAAGQWSVSGKVMRKSTTAVNIVCQGTIQTNTAAFTTIPQAVTKITGLSDLSLNTAIIKCTGQAGTGGATNDVLGSTKCVIYIPA